MSNNRQYVTPAAAQDLLPPPIFSQNSENFRRPRTPLQDYHVDDIKKLSIGPVGTPVGGIMYVGARVCVCVRARARVSMVGGDGPGAHGPVGTPVYREKGDLSLPLPLSLSLSLSPSPYLSL